MKKKIVAVILATTLVATACGQADGTGAITAENKEEEQIEAVVENTEMTLSPLASENAAAGSAVFEVIDTEEMFTERDQQQTPDLSEAVYLTVSDGEDIVIDTEGVYVLSGQAENVTIRVAADSKDKVQLVLDDLQITNTDTPCIYVSSADKVFLTTVSGNNRLTVNGTFTADGDTNTDAVIFSKDNLVLNGTGSLQVVSTDNGITSKDGIKITGGSYEISCERSAIEAHEEIEISDGTIVVSKCNDGLHAENDDDDTTGTIYIGGGSLQIAAADDAIHATTIVRIDAGEMVLDAAEGIEATDIQINGGTIVITASDDGINAAQKSSSLTPLFEMNGGDVTITMGAGDTDGVDANGDIIINGGTIRIDGNSTFDYDGKAEYNGGTIIENGEETNTITNQFMGGPGGFGGRGGFPEGMERPEGSQRPEGMERPEGSQRPEGMELPEGVERPEGMQRPEGMTPPEGMGRPGGHGGQGGIEKPEERGQN